jgi:DNA-binding LacI/PurR family transcriptional regulator
MKATLKEVAERAGVSISTVSRALSGKAHVDPETRDRIRAAILVLNYPVPGAPPDLKPQRTGMLGLLMPEGMQRMGTNTSIYAAVVGSARVAAESAGYGISVATYTNGPEIVTVGDRLLAQGSLEGAILYRVRLADEGFERFRELGLPFIVINRLFDRPSANCVGTDQTKCGYLATQHLIGLGHRRIGFITGITNVGSYVGRLAGYRQALDEVGVTPQRSWIVECDTDADSVEAATLSLLAQPDRPTALIAANDRNAGMAIKAATSAGISVPEDLSIVGFDDAEEAAFFTPPLTTVRLEWAQMAELATLMLCEIIARPAVSRLSIALEPSLVVRQSTCAPRAG